MCLSNIHGKQQNVANVDKWGRNSLKIRKISEKQQIC